MTPHKALKDYGYLGTPAQVAAITLALDTGAEVLFVYHPTLGELGFLVFRPVTAEVEAALNALVQSSPTWFPTRYVTDNQNFTSPYWNIEF